MKNLLFFAIFTITGSVSLGQTNLYHPFPDSNAVWVEDSWFIDAWTCLNYDDHNLFMAGDTTVGNFTYHKLYKNGWVTIFCPPNSPPPYFYAPIFWGAFRQDSANKKVYLYQNDNESLAYDFNLNVGDTLPPSCLYWFNYVLSIDSVLVGSQYHKRFWLSDGNHNNYAALIEGIGSTFGAFSFIASPFEAGGELYCVKINDQTVWTYDTASQCHLFTQVENLNSQIQTFLYPNPFSVYTILKINTTLKDAKLTMYNTLGQKMKSIINISGQSITLRRDNLPAGVYFLILSQGNTIITENKVLIKD